MSAAASMRSAARTGEADGAAKRRTPAGQKALIAAVAALVTAIAADMTLRSRTAPATAPDDRPGLLSAQMQTLSDKLDDIARQIADTNVLLGRYDERLKQIERRIP